MRENVSCRTVAFFGSCQFLNDLNHFGLFEKAKIQSFFNETKFKFLPAHPGVNIFGQVAPSMLGYQTKDMGLTYVLYNDRVEVWSSINNNTLSFTTDSFNSLTNRCIQGVCDFIKTMIDNKPMSPDCIRISLLYDVFLFGEEASLDLLLNHSFFSGEPLSEFSMRFNQQITNKPDFDRTINAVTMISQALGSKKNLEKQTVGVVLQQDINTIANGRKLDILKIENYLQHFKEIIYSKISSYPNNIK